MEKQQKMSLQRAFDILNGHYVMTSIGDNKTSAEDFEAAIGIAMDALWAAMNHPDFTVGQPLTRCDRCGGLIPALERCLNCGFKLK